MSLELGEKKVGDFFLSFSHCVDGIGLGTESENLLSFPFGRSNSVKNRQGEIC